MKVKIPEPTEEIEIYKKTKKISNKEGLKNLLGKIEKDIDSLCENEFRKRFIMVSYSCLINNEQEHYLVMQGGFDLSAVPNKEKFLLDFQKRYKTEFRDALEYRNFPATLEILITGSRDALQKEVKARDPYGNN